MKSEFRKDLVSGEWILIATGRKARPSLFVPSTAPRQKPKRCPFDDPQKSGNPPPVAWYPHPHAKAKDKSDVQSWFVQVIPNKYPIVAPHDGICPARSQSGPYQHVEGVGRHEVIITRPHAKDISRMSVSEVTTIVSAYRDRYDALGGEQCVKYVLVFHNHGEHAGASIPHPHSQVIALPIVPPDVARSLSGSRLFFQKERVCVHCTMLKWESREKKRVLFENESCIVILPYASRVSFEARIYPKKHHAYFSSITAAQQECFAEALAKTLAVLRRGLKNPDYNFFIHTALKDGEERYYHWHLEVLPRTYKWAGLELGTGIEVVAVSPEEAAAQLKKYF